MPVLPGLYTISLYLQYQDSSRLMAGPVQFEAMPLSQSPFSLEAAEANTAFFAQVGELYQSQLGLLAYVADAQKQLTTIRQMLHNYPGSKADMAKEAKSIAQALASIDFALKGTAAKASWEEIPPAIMPLQRRMQHIIWGAWDSSEAPTQSMKMNYNILTEQLPPLLNQAEEIDLRITKLQQQLDKINAPWTPGRVPKFVK